LCIGMPSFHGSAVGTNDSSSGCLTPAPGLLSWLKRPRREVGIVVVELGSCSSATTR
jgi:hypothetical protein